MKKRSLALLLAATMMLSGICGCGKEETEEQAQTITEETATTEVEGEAETSDKYEINFDEEPYEAVLMYWVANDARDVESVEEAFNELTMKQLNMKVDLQPVTFGGYMQQIQMILSSDDKLDIFPMFGSNAGTYINAEYVEDITPYLNSVAKDLIDVVGIEDISCCSIGDFIWGIPTMHERCNPTAYVLCTDVLEETGYKAEDIKTLEDLTEVFAKVKELYPEMIAYSGLNGSTQGATQQTFDSLGGGNYGVLMDNGQELTVSNWYESEEFRSVVETYYEWAQKGYSSADLATSSDAGEAMMRAGNLFSFSTYWKPNTKVEKDAQTGCDTTIVRMTEPFCCSAATNSVGYSIASNSEDPEKAALLLNWIYKTKEANDLLNWGIEGVDYTVLEDGTIGYPEGINADNVGYHQDFGWAQPNQYNSYVWTGNEIDIWEQYQEMRNNALVSKAYGFNFDTTPVLNEISALTAVSDQYLVTIAAGAVEPEQAIKEFNDALYNAGLQTVMDEKQKQLDEWYAVQ